MNRRRRPSWSSARPPTGGASWTGTRDPCGRTRLAKAIVVAAPSSGSGKTLITLGLLRAFRNAGVRVAAAKVGPDYIDPRFHEAATGRACYNLDPWAMNASQIKGLAGALARDADLVIIEGVMGLFDGPRGAKGSTADLAVMLGLPVIFTLDCRHQAQSAAALVHGFYSYNKDLELAGVILNRTASERHELLLREALGEQVLMALRNDETLAWPSRHLGLVQAQENKDLDAFIEAAALRVNHKPALERILDLARPLHGSEGAPVLPPLAQSVAVARDDAFSFIYRHLLDGWRRQGASLSFFSPLADEAPDPEAEAVFLPGGYPELHAGRIAGNRRFLDGLRSHSGTVYGECGGYMVLGESLIDSKGMAHGMAGLLPLVTSFAKRKLHLGYRQLEPLTDGPWSAKLMAHEFHYSTLVSEGQADRLFGARDAAGNPLENMGLRRGKVMGSYAHVIAGAP
ncbi:cobyrinic acid a,c-diamide synthase [Aestuariivirga litoralis]|uniref:Hydrogenobyrinate a,c-diamide synthase n=1 Tax=Aestuariivirga litoralis TaxID=2650924 RepID=A0A2W2C9F5_9HYPH|nr:cobyrinic acid a,c-diamide synthase [Aestuariivirga litoralis]